VGSRTTNGNDSNTIDNDTTQLNTPNNIIHNNNTTVNANKIYNSITNDSIRTHKQQRQYMLH